MKALVIRQHELANRKELAKPAHGSRDFLLRARDAPTLRARCNKWAKGVREVRALKVTLWRGPNFPDTVLKELVD